MIFTNHLQLSFNSIVFATKQFWFREIFIIQNRYSLNAMSHSKLLFFIRCPFIVPISPFGSVEFRIHCHQFQFQRFHFRPLYERNILCSSWQLSRFSAYALLFISVKFIFFGVLLIWTKGKWLDWTWGGIFKVPHNNIDKNFSACFPLIT